MVWSLSEFAEWLTCALHRLPREQFEEVKQLAANHTNQAEKPNRIAITGRLQRVHDSSEDVAHRHTHTSKHDQIDPEDNAVAGVINSGDCAGMATLKNQLIGTEATSASPPQLVVTSAASKVVLALSREPAKLLST